jgi:thymidylate kinase
MHNGAFILIDGIAGSGKTTVIQAMHDALVAQGLHCFRLHDWQENHPPTFEEIPDFDVYFTLEPTRQWVGAAIRLEMSQKEHPYGGKELAHAFAIDREIMYRRLIIPALKAGKTIVQDRGVSTSIIYQPIQLNSLSLEEILDLPGNKLALQIAPSHLVLTSTPVEKIIDRIRNRPASQGAAGVFADVELARRVDTRYREPWFRDLFESRGTHIHTLDTSGTLAESQTNAVSLITQLLGT